VSPLLPLAGLVVGAGAGFAADRLSVRWPEHEEGVAARGRDWRTVVLVLAGASVVPALLFRWPDPLALVVLVPFALALLVLLATDLDQRLLPDLITLPMIAIAAVVLVLGWSPLLAGKQFALVSGLAAGIGAPAFLFATDYLIKGALGFGDLKLAVSIGFLTGVSRLFVGFLVASVGFAALLIVLMAVRRLGLRTAVPFGPVLIGAALVAMLLP
jgi:leader peptidase (prepilin peptidase) / N-methyltransferase